MGIRIVGDGGADLEAVGVGPEDILHRDLDVGRGYRDHGGDEGHGTVPTLDPDEGLAVAAVADDLDGFHPHAPQEAGDGELLFKVVFATGHGEVEDAAAVGTPDGVICAPDDRGDAVVVDADVPRPPEGNPPRQPHGGIHDDEGTESGRSGRVDLAEGLFRHLRNPTVRPPVAAGQVAPVAWRDDGVLAAGRRAAATQQTSQDQEHRCARHSSHFAPSATTAAIITSARQDGNRRARALE